MAILTDSMERKLLDHIFKKAEYTRPSYLHMGLSTTAFTDSDSASAAYAKEPSGNAYARVQVDNKIFYDHTNEDLRNTSSIDWAEATGAWGDIEYWGIFDGSGSSAALVMHGSFSAATTVSSGDQFRISTGDFEINFPATIYTGGLVYNANNSSSNVFAKWREQIGYLLGFDWSGSQDVNEMFLFHTSSSSGFTHDELYLGVSASAFPTSGLTTFEVSRSSTNYTRVHLSSSDFGSAATSSGTTTITNTSPITFGEASASWGNISHFAIFRGSDDGDFHDATGYSVTGNHVNSIYPLISGALTTTKAVGSGDRLRFGIGDLVITAS